MFVFVPLIILLFAYIFLKHPPSRMKNIHLKVEQRIKNINSDIKEYALILISLYCSFVFFLISVSYRTVVDIVDNNTGYFAVYIQNSEMFIKNDHVLFYNSDNELVRNIEFNIRGDLNIESDANKVIVEYNRRRWYFDWEGNEFTDNIPDFEPVVRMDTPFIKPVKIECKRNFWGYEYLFVKKNDAIYIIQLNIKYYLIKLCGALAETIIVFIVMMLLLNGELKKIFKSLQQPHK